MILLKVKQMEQEERNEKREGGRVRGRKNGKRKGDTRRRYKKEQSLKRYLVSGSQWPVIVL